MNVMIEQGRMDLAGDLLLRSLNDATNSLMSPLATAWIRQEGAAPVIRWLEQLPRGSGHRLGAITGIASGIASESPDIAESFMQAFPIPYERLAAAGGIVQSITDKGEMVRAQEWILKNIGDNAEGVFDAAIMAYFGRLNLHPNETVSPEANVELLAKVKNEGMRTSNAIFFIRHMGSTRPDLVMKAALHLPVERRENQLAMTASGWAQSDPAAARRAIENLGSITTQTRENLLGVVERAAQRAAK
jgi:hypothetical protein